MDGSHASCAKLFECSCPELEDLVSAAKVTALPKLLGRSCVFVNRVGCPLLCPSDLPSLLESLVLSAVERCYGCKTNWCWMGGMLCLPGAGG